MANSETNNYWQDNLTGDNTPFTAGYAKGVGDEMGDAELNSIRSVVDSLQSARSELQSMLSSVDSSEQAAINGAISELSGSIASLKGSISTRSRSGASASVVMASNAISNVKERLSENTFEQAQTAAYVADQNITFQSHATDYTQFTLANNFEFYNSLDAENKVVFQGITQRDMEAMTKQDKTFGSAVITANIIEQNAELSGARETARAENRAAMNEARAYGDAELTQSLDELSSVLKSRGQSQIAKKDASGKMVYAQNANDYSLKEDWAAFKQVVKDARADGVVSETEQQQITAAKQELLQKIKAETTQRSTDFDKVNKQTLGLFTDKPRADLVAMVGSNDPAKIHEFITKTKLTPGQNADLNNALYIMGEHGEAGYDKLSKEQKQAFLIARAQTNFQINDSVADLKEYFAEMPPEKRQAEITNLVGKIKEGKQGREEAIAILETALDRPLSEATKRTIRDSKDPKTLEAMVNGIVASGDDGKEAQPQSLTVLRNMNTATILALHPDIGLNKNDDRLSYIDPDQLQQYNWLNELINDVHTGKAQFSATTIAPPIAALTVPPANNNNSVFANLLRDNQVNTNWNQVGSIPLTKEDMVKKEQSQTQQSSIAYSGDFNAGNLFNVGQATNARDPSTVRQATALAL